MAMKKLTAGTILYDHDLNGNYTAILNTSFQNHIRNLILAAQIYDSYGNYIFAEAYTDSNGRNNSVTTTLTATTPIFDTNKYRLKTTNDILASDLNTYTNAIPLSTPFVLIKTITYPYYCSTVTYEIDTGNSIYRCYTYLLFKYSDLTTETTPEVESRFGNWESLTVNNPQPTKLITEIELWGRALTTPSDYRNVKVYSTNDTTAMPITHTIPAGTFGSTISSACIKALVANTETGATITHELKNGSESSGVIQDGVITQFTAFTSQPTQLITTLTPKSTSPTAGYPEIYGVAGRAE